MARGDDDAVVSHFAIRSVEAIMSRDHLDVAPFLRSVEQSAGLTVYDTWVSDEVAASILMKQIGKDFDDALQYYVATKLGASEIVSFDRDFDGLEIPRSEPSNH